MLQLTYMQYELTCGSDLIARLPGLLDEVGCDVVTMRECVVAPEGISFKLMSCARHGATADVTVCTRQADSQHVVNVSISLRHIVRFWQWRADVMLVREIARRIRTAGAVELTE